MNALYLHRNSNFDSKELKHSLRSVAMYLNPEKVYIAGDKPQWAVNVEHIPSPKKDNPYSDTNAQFRKALKVMPEGKYVLMHDDMFLLKEYEHICYYDGLMKDAHIGGERKRLFENQGMEGNLNYALHYPMPFVHNGEWEWKKDVSMMCVLGNRGDFPSKKASDCKYHPNLVNEKFLQGTPCFSTYNENEALEDLLLKLYPYKSIFEV